MATAHSTFSCIFSTRICAILCPGRSSMPLSARCTRKMAVCWRCPLCGEISCEDDVHATGMPLACDNCERALLPHETLCTVCESPNPWAPPRFAPLLVPRVRQLADVPFASRRRLTVVPPYRKVATSGARETAASHSSQIASRQAAFLLCIHAPGPTSSVTLHSIEAIAIDREESR